MKLARAQGVIRRAGATVVWVVMSCALASAARAEAFAAGLEARLAALTPALPMGYFELAEEVAAESPGAEGVALARRLFVLAYALEAPAGPLRASACIALASLADAERDRRRLLALSEALREDAGASQAPVGGGAPGMAAPVSDAPFVLATALGLYRSGEYARAATLFEREDVRGLLERYSAMVGGSEALLREVRSRPACRECRNQRVVKGEDTGAGGMPPLRLCYTCNGNPGPALEPGTLLNLMRVESALLAGAQQSWATQLLADKAAPLDELTPEGLAGVYNIDTSKSVRRDGQWVSP